MLGTKVVEKVLSSDMAQDTINGILKMGCKTDVEHAYKKLNENDNCLIVYASSFSIAQIINIIQDKRCDTEKHLYNFGA